MPPNISPIRVVQCPQCGGPVDGVSAGDVASCSYCGAALPVSAGASGHPVTKSAQIRTSASQLPRLEELERLRAHLGQRDEALSRLRETHQTKLIGGRTAESGAIFSCLVGLVLLLFGLIMIIERELLVGFVLIVIGIILLFAIKWFRHRAAALGKEADRIRQESEAARAERDRLAQCVAALEPDSEEVDNKLPLTTNSSFSQISADASEYPTMQAPKKARSEAKQSTHKTQKTPFLLILLLLAVVSCVIIYLLDSPSSTESAGVGDKVRLSHGSTGPQEIMVAIDEKTFGELVDIMSARDVYGLQTLLNTGRVFVVPAGTEALILGWSSSRFAGPVQVRILEGAYAGKKGWTLEEAIP